jgi:quercetin dioxygenase-like cupin family protein
MSTIQAVREDALSWGSSSPGIARHLAFQGEGFQVIRSRIAAGALSGWHHHEDYEVCGYVVSGTARLESGPEGRDVVTLHAGDFLHVPAHTVHRESNPSPNERGEVILFMRGTGPMVANVAGPEQL